MLARTDPVQFLPLLFFIARFRDIIFKKDPLPSSGICVFIFFFYVPKSFLFHPLPSPPVYYRPLFFSMYGKLANAVFDI